MLLTAVLRARVRANLSRVMISTTYNYGMRVFQMTRDMPDFRVAMQHNEWRADVSNPAAAVCRHTSWTIVAVSTPDDARCDLGQAPPAPSRPLLNEPISRRVDATYSGPIVQC
jgi:hypothetical protein